MHPMTSVFITLSLLPYTQYLAILTVLSTTNLFFLISKALYQLLCHANALNIFEELNSLAINVYSVEEKEIFPLQLSENVDSKEINLFIYKSHYFLIRHFNRLFDSKSLYVCHYCLYSIKSKELIMEHEKTCRVHGAQRVKYPKEEWKKKDAQAKGIITCAMTDSLVALILNCKTSKDIWIALHEIYEVDKKKSIIEARNDVSRLTMKKEENWEEYLYRSEKLLEQARNLGAEIEDQEFTTSGDQRTTPKVQPCCTSTELPNEEYETTQQPEEWVVDNGASCHMTSNRDLLKEEREVHKTIKLADDSEIISNAEGAIEIEGQNKLIRLNDVLYVEKLSGNLMSVNKLVDDNKKVLFDKDGGHIMEEDGEEILMAQRINDFYIIKTSAPEEIPSQALKATLHTWNDWHKRLGHLNEEYMKQMLKNNSAHNFNIQSQNMDTCQVCIQAKHPRTPFKPVLYPQSTRPLDLIHIDLIGPIQEESIGGAKYVLTLVDDFSRKIFVEFLSSKLETFDIIRSFIEEIEKEKEIKIKQLRSEIMENNSQMIK
ncbi:hypothetical protein LAZ67_2005624 [Cordylochernes scorpioides]|uniref:Integrase catalytic domain-containing protein n=1 Tax=Cordylochernes scorpioides TaxID=51811 RepID=A0ABY6K5C5_9ARAC|nr:hypothetical protein LAZ67_2005624 [Cordylochernes scorpioides]